MQEKSLTLPIYLWKTVTGKLGHYQDQNSSFDELLLFYKNHRDNNFEDKVIEPQKYLDKFFFELKKSTRFPSTVKPRKRKLMFSWKERMVFLYYNRKDILITLLQNIDYNSTKSKDEAIVSIYKWLQGIDDENYPIVNSWKQDIEKQNSEIIAIMSHEESIELKDNSKLTLENIRKYDEIKTASNFISFPKEEKYFWQLLNGITDEEKKKLFDSILLKLSDKYIIQIDTDTYQWRHETKGKLRYLCGLIYVLTENNYLTIKISPKDLADLINQWLKHTCKTSSLEKRLQPEELKIFTEKKLYKYTEDFFAYFPQKKS